MQIPSSKGSLKPKELKELELQITDDFRSHKDDTKHDLTMRQNGVSCRRGSSGYQLVGYAELERFYRGDQWDHNEPPGAAQNTDNYCSVIIDSISSLPFDDTPEINCPTNDPTDDLLELKAEAKEKLLWKVWKDNAYKVEFDEWSKVGSLYGDGFLKGPWAEKDKNGKWKIKFAHVENPGSIMPIYADASFKELLGFIDTTRISHKKAERLYGAAAKAKGIKIEPSIKSTAYGARKDEDTKIPMVDISEYWTDKIMGVFINDTLLDFSIHNWGFVPLRYAKNIYIPNYPYGKSDIEDVLDPQLLHNRVNNDLANFLKWISQVNLWGKNIETMQALVAGISRIYSIPEDGELHSFEKPGDPYIANTFVQQRRSSIVEISGISESMLSSSQLAGSSGRALAMAFQGILRKINPRIKRFSYELEQLNENILKLMEIYYPQTKFIIEGDYRNEIFLPTTLLRNIVDTLNKLSAGVISLDTAQREAGIHQPKQEQKLIKKTLMDPILGPQIARQPGLLPRLQEGQNQPGEAPMPAPGNQPAASPAGAVNASAQHAGGAAPTPVTE